MLKLSWTRAAAWRATRHHLHRRAPTGSMLAVARRLCGLHAQVLSSAELTLWARVDHLDRDALPRALWDQRTLVKTWAMRGTLHLLPSAELPFWHAALGASRRYLREQAWKNYFGITLKELDALTEAIGTALTGQILTREKLMHEVTRLTGDAPFARNVVASSWGTILKPAAFSGRLCFGPSIGQRVQFTHPATWLSADPASTPAPIDPDSVPAEITRRFLAAYAPATPHDLARWWGGAGGLTNARRWLASLGEEAVAVDLEGTPAWMLAAHAGELRHLPPLRSVRLLPGFDQYVIGASWHAAHLLPGDFRARIFRPQGWVSPVLLVNGRMQGTWRHELKTSRLAVEIRPFVPVPTWVRTAAAHEAERLSAFLGSPFQLTWKK